MSVFIPRSKPRSSQHPPHTRSHQSQGVALISAMLVCLFLVMLTGALIQTQSGAFALAQSSDARLRARVATQSLYDYCLYQIEHNRDWGKDGFASTQTVDPLRRDNQSLAELADHVQIKSVKNNTFQGYLPDHNVGFDVEVVNALTSASGATASDGTSINKEEVRLIIRTWNGRDPAKGRFSLQRADCLLRLAPLFDGAIVSRGDIDIDTDQIAFASKDPFRNEIRSEGDVTLPGVRSGHIRFIKHNDLLNLGKTVPINSFAKDENGLLWSKGNLKESATPLDTAGLAEAAQATGGRIITDAQGPADIYDLKPTDLPQPVIKPGHDIRTPSGEFRFTTMETKVDYTTTNVLGHEEHHTTTRSANVVEYYKNPPTHNPGDPPPTPDKILVSSAPPNMYWNQTFKSETLINAPPGVPIAKGRCFALDASADTGVTLEDNAGHPLSSSEMGFHKIDATASAPVVLDLDTQMITVAPNTRVRPAEQGSEEFKMTVVTGGGGRPTKPMLKLGDQGNDVVLETKGDLTIGSSDPTTSTTSEVITSGGGTLISSNGSVTVTPSARSFHWTPTIIGGRPVWVPQEDPWDRNQRFEANKDYTGLAIYAGKDVTINGGTSGSDWDFQGFVYARDNFNYNVGAANSTFYGSVIAGMNRHAGDGVKIKSNGGRIVFDYDPDYLRILTRQLPDHQAQAWTRLEILTWAESNG